MQALPPPVAGLPERGGLVVVPKPERAAPVPESRPPRSARALLGFFLNAAIFLLMAGCVGAAWLAQAYYFHRMGDLPDGGSAPFYVLLGGWGMRRVLTLTPDGAFALYGVAIAAFGLLAALVHRRALRSPAYEPMLEVGAAAAPAPRTRPSAGRAIALGLGLLSAGAAFIFLLLFTHASAGADHFLTPDGSLKKYERFLKHFYGALGYRARPNAFWPFYAWIGAAISGAVVVWLAGRLRGLPWSAPTEHAPNHPSRQRWEWIVVGLWVVVATACYLWGSGQFPSSFNQSEALIGLGAKALLRKDVVASVFDNTIQPSTCFVHRAAAVAFVGPTIEAQRLATAIASGAGMIFGFLALRSFVAFAPAFLTMVIFSFCAVTLHYSRTGLDNIEAMYWIMLAIWVFHGAESSPPGVGRFVKYYATGWVAGGSFGQFTGAPLAAVVIAAMLAIRFFFQTRARRSLLVDIALLAFGFGVAFSPFVLDPGELFLRQGLVSILRPDVLPTIFAGPDGIAHPGASLSTLIAYRTLNAALGFFSLRDWVGEFGSTYPFSGPLLSALALLGAPVLALRCRSWHTVWIVGLFGMGAVLGGALLFGPDPPSSARLLMLMPALLASAATALHLMTDCFSSALDGLRVWSAGRRLAPALWLAAGVGLGGWAVGADMYNNVSMYLQICRDPNVNFNGYMVSTTEIYQFFEKYQLSPVRNYEYIADVTAEQSNEYNNYLNPELKAASRPMASGSYPSPRELPSGLIMFLAQRCEPCKSDLKAIMALYPGGRLTRTEPVEVSADHDWHYYIYLYRNRGGAARTHRAPGLVEPPPAEGGELAPPMSATPASGAPAAVADAPTSPTLQVPEPRPASADALSSPGLPISPGGAIP